MNLTFVWVLLAAGVSVTEEKSGYELWGECEKRVAVVNPVCGEDPANVLSLGGEWDCWYGDYVPQRLASWGVSCAKYPEQLDGVMKKTKVRLPGVLEVQGVGEPGVSRTWDCFWDSAARPLRHVFKGCAWLRRSFAIPAAWAGRRIWLKVGDVTSQGWFWVNGRPVAWHENWCGTYKYEITDFVKPGEAADFLIQVSNEVAARKGLRNYDNRWTGLPRDLELEATPRTFIDDAWVRGDFDSRTAEVHVVVEGDGDCEARVSITGWKNVGGTPVSVTAKVEKGDNLIRVPLADFRPWSPEHPNLYVAKIKLVENGKVTTFRRERFGVRKFEVRGRDFYLNDRPFFVRGIGYHAISPVRGPEMLADRGFRRSEVKKMREAGFNFARLHTRCETPEFFEACDELGLMLQPEMPYYNDCPTEKFEFNPVRDAKEIHVHYRRHPSFAVYSHGNEGSFGAKLGRKMYEMIHEMDPDRLVVEQDGTSWMDGGKGDSFEKFGRHFNSADRADFCYGPIDVWPRGKCRWDRPMVAHEYLNLTVKADASLEDRYAGIWKTPFTKKMRMEFLARHGLGEFWDGRLQRAQHALAKIWYKRGIESARLDPECGGYYYWSAQDVTVPQKKDGVAAFTAQGLFTSFWGEKPGGVTAAESAVFNSPSCVLCDTLPRSRILVSGEDVTNTVYFAHYGEETIVNAKLGLRLVEKPSGKVIAQGAIPVKDQDTGGVRKIVNLVFAVPEVESAAAVEFECEIGGVKNSWDMWIFPKRAVMHLDGVCILEPFAAKLAERYSGLLAPADVTKAAVVVALAGSEDAEAALARGQKVVTLDSAEGEPDVKLGWWWLGDQTGTAIADHPALAGMPHGEHLDGLFFRIFKKGAKLPEEGLSERDLAVVCEGGFGCRYNLAVTGREIRVRGLDVCADLPEAKALLDGLLGYSVSHGEKKGISKFVPEVQSR